MLAKRNVEAKIESQLKSTAKSEATAKDSKGEGEIKMIMCAATRNDVSSTSNPRHDVCEDKSGNASSTCTSETLS